MKTLEPICQQDIESVKTLLNVQKYSTYLITYHCPPVHWMKQNTMQA